MRSDPLTRARTVWKNRTISSGVAYPTVSGRFTVVAPASMTASTTATRKFRSLRVASSAENSTSFTWRRARRTAAAAWSRHSARDIRSLCSRWRSDVAMNVWMRGRAAPSSAAAARSMSASTERASAATMGRRTSRAMARTELKSSSEAIGKPASITSTPRVSSFRARRTFSASHIEKPGACSPSRSVVSKIVMRAGAAARTWLSVLSMSGHLVHDDRVQERHLRAQLGADLLDEKVLLPFASRLERRTPVAVFFDPLLGVGPVLDLLEDLLHLAARRLGDDAGAGGVVAVLGCVADGIAHVVEAAAVHEVDDELQLVQALEVRDLGLVARVDECLEARLTSAAVPPQRTACSPKRSVSVSSANVVSRTPARVEPRARAYASASSRAWPLAFCSIARSAGVPSPSWNSSRTRWRGAFGAIIDTSTSAGGTICPKRMLKPCANMSVFPAFRYGAIDSS